MRRQDRYEETRTLFDRDGRPLEVGDVVDSSLGRGRIVGSVPTPRDHWRIRLHGHHGTPVRTWSAPGWYLLLAEEEG